MISLQQSPVLLTTAYCPPIQYFSKFLLNRPVFIEQFENIQKQSYRNRCYIYGANGKLCLIIPLKKQHGEKTPIREVEIDYEKHWQKIHFKSIESAYRLSAFYEYYADEFKALYEIEIPLLFDWNMRLLELLLKLTGITHKPELTETWIKDPGSIAMDMRQSIHPKERLMKSDPDFSPSPYQQVFQERNGFIPNLSIMDLLCNEGPHALDILRKSLVYKI